MNPHTLLPAAVSLTALALSGAAAAAVVVGPPGGKYVCTVVNYAASGYLAYQYVDTLIIVPPQRYRLEVNGGQGTYRYFPTTTTVAFTSGPLRAGWEGRYVSPKHPGDVPTVRLHNKTKASRQFDWTCATSRRRP